MDIQFTFRHMDPTPALKEYAQKHLRRIVSFLEKEKPPVCIEFVLEPSKNHAHNRAELRIKTAQYNRVTHHEGPDFYKVLDHVIDVMYRELHEDKQRRVDDLRKRSKTNELEVENEQIEGDEEEFD